MIPTPRRELIAAGAVDRSVDDALRAGRSVAVFRGIHVDRAQANGLRARMHAALTTQREGSVVAMQSSAVLHQLRWLPSAWSADDTTVHIAIEPPATRRHRAGLRFHERVLEPLDRVLIDGVPTMSVTRTLVELARDARLPRLLVVQVIDGALRDERTTKAELFACLARFRGERGVARARGLVDQSREEVDSPQETRMRLMLEDDGITGLDVNIKIHDDEGFVVARGDLGIKRLLIWGEYDGFGPHTERETFRNDRPRHRWLSRRGWDVMRFADADLTRPAQTCREWRAAIADAPARIAALPASRSPEVAAARRALGFDAP